MMKKLLLALSVSMALAVGAQTVFAADCNTCPKPKKDCGYPTIEKTRCNQCHKPKNECGCKEIPKCESCGEMAKNCFSDCWDQRREELYCRLNLDSCQRNEADSIEDRYRDDIDSVKDRIKDDHKCLCDKIHASCLDKQAIRDAEKVLKADFKDLKKQLKCMDKEFKGILQCEQKKEYRKFKREMKYKGKKAMKYCCKPCKK